MKPAPQWLKATSIAVTATVGVIFYGVGLHEGNDTLYTSGAVLIGIGMVCWVLTTKMPD